jgi:hypothetical protein
MALYLDKEALVDLDEYRRQIFALREEAYKKHNIDILDNDTLSALSVYEVVQQYDADYNINFSRNGEDAKSQGVLIEQKCSRIQKKKRSKEYPMADFQFHAMGDLEYSRYILASRDKANLDLVRIYDVSNPANTKLIQDHLNNEKNKWLERGKKDQSKMKRDVITMPEKVMHGNLVGITTTIINGCEVIKD